MSSVAAPAPRADVKRQPHWLDDELWLGRLLIAPAVVYIVALVGFPFALAIVYSLSDATVGSTSLDYVGLRNFVAIMDDPTFWQSLRNAVVFTLASQALVVVLGKVLAMALYRDFRGKWLVRLLILLPWVAPISLGSIGWLWIFDPVYSIINWSARALGLFGPHTWPVWLGQPELAMASIVMVDVWRLLPLATVIILAGLSAIPQDIHDAAQVDGAGFWRHLFMINVPLVMPIMLVALLFGIVFTFTDLIVIYVLTRGGPFDSTQVIASYAFFTGIEGGDLAGGAAISLFLFPVLVAVAILFLTVARRAEVA
ncbi:MAG: sugar ABC transporter permease [Burkholderiaceae bacterium]|nr:sugar ABC transporter permease [Burkholderiaceae bacterium]MEB2352873.1 sugar ABC transporter permease [Burkholderiaceae bacterium]